MSFFMGRTSKAFPEQSEPARAPASPSWELVLQDSLAALDNEYPGQFGVFVKHPGSGHEFSFRGDETWYLASGVKVPVAVETLAQVEAGELSLEQSIVLREEDKLDGSPILGAKESGSSFPVRYLLEQMLTHSDNTASDMLINLVGIKNVNRRLQELVPDGFNEITSLAGVRTLAYSEFSVGAEKLRNADFLKLQAEGESSRVRALASILGEEERDFRFRRLNEGFESYYAQGWNSGTLRAYATLLEKIAGGRALSAELTQYLLRVMEKTATGKNRVKAGLGEEFTWAHKTGTQHRRVCDFGIAWPKNNHWPANPVVMAACTRGFVNTADAEKVLASLGQALARSGIFSQP